VGVFGDEIDVEDARCARGPGGIIGFDHQLAQSLHGDDVTAGPHL
jgi:hypothetical protein